MEISSINLNYLTYGIFPTEAETRLLNISQDSTLDESDFYSLSLHDQQDLQNYALLSGINFAQRFGLSHLNLAKNILMREMVVRIFGSLTRDVLPLVEKYAGSAHLSDLQEMLLKWKKVYNLSVMNKTLSDSDKIRLICCLVLVDAKAYSDEVNNQEFKDLLNDIEEKIFSGRVEFKKTDLNINHVQAIFQVDPTAEHLGSFLFPNDDPLAFDVFHELIHLYQVKVPPLAEEEFNKVYLSRELEAFRYAALYQYAKSGREDLEAFEENFQIHEEKVGEYLTRLAYTQSYLEQELGKSPSSLNLRAKMFVNYLTQMRNTRFITHFPQHEALLELTANYHGFSRDHLNLERSILLKYNRGMMKPVLDNLGQLFISTYLDAIIQNIQLGKEVLKAQMRDRIIAAYSNHDQLAVALLLVDFYFDALFDDDFNQVIARFEKEFIEPYTEKIHQELTPQILQTRLTGASN